MTERVLLLFLDIGVGTDVAVRKEGIDWSGEFRVSNMMILCLDKIRRALNGVVHRLGAGAGVLAPSQAMYIFYACSRVSFVFFLESKSSPSMPYLCYSSCGLSWSPCIDF